MNLSKVKQVRISKGISQTRMAKLLGYKYASGYANLENGRNKPSLEKAKQIAEILGADVEELFFEEKLHVKGKNTSVS
ncbi:XRE family transcriptional regulator [Halalkalibacterium halodurans]|uniref:helix-turn-helix transcriptional regulator n=1 Tax=Halalkalibacterium halodurans TaxID=86665 RepID=UPI0010678D6B|nr:helix-turn-helix transcriptional regulator [Halalkalibacterium halodurans]TES56157.1 XRE family transcriptional regulator [Halalkalibacterium halodurans]